MNHVVVAPGLTWLLMHSNRNKAKAVAENKTFWGRNGAFAHLLHLTFKVHRSVSVVVRLSDHSLNFVFARFFAQQLHHGVSQLLWRDGAVTVDVKLQASRKRTGQGGNGVKAMPRLARFGQRRPAAIPHSIHCEVPEATCENGCAGLTSLNASLSSFRPIMPAVSARSLGDISSTKSSKSTRPPTVCRGNGSVLSMQYKVHTL